MAGLPPVGGVFLQEPEGGGGLCRRDPGLQLPAVHRAQGAERVEPFPSSSPLTRQQNKLVQFVPVFKLWPVL